MITAVDTNVLVDVLEPDPRHGAASADALTRCLAEGAVVACDIVWAEVATVYGDRQAELLAALQTLCIDYSEVTREAALEGSSPLARLPEPRRITAEDRGGLHHRRARARPV